MHDSVVYNENCILTMSRMEDNSVDLTVTSPPYDNIRDYNGFSFDWKSTIKELYRITKDGGVVVWIVSDQTIDGSETGSSFKQALWAMECGFNLHDTMIWEKDSCAFPEATRYYPVFEYMFVWSKGKPKSYNPICDRNAVLLRQPVLRLKPSHIPSFSYPFPSIPSISAQSLASDACLQ